MRQNKTVKPLGLTNRKRNKLKGMTLIEVIVGMTIILIVTIIAYMGVSAGANFIQRGNDLRDADSQAAERIESAVNQYRANGAEEDAVSRIYYNVVVRTKETAPVSKTSVNEEGSAVAVTEMKAVTNSEGNDVFAAESSVLTDDSASAVFVRASADPVNYVMVLPPVSAVPTAAPEETP